MGMGRHSENVSVRGQLLAVIVLAGIAVGVIVFVLSGGNAPGPTSAKAIPGAPSLSGKLRPLCGKPIGRPDAKVRVQAFLPVTIGCQDPIGVYLVEQARKFPRGIYLRIYDMKEEAARLEMAKYGLHCAAVVINGTTRFDLEGRDNVISPHSRHRYPSGYPDAASPRAFDAMQTIPRRKPQESRSTRLRLAVQGFRPV